MLRIQTLGGFRIWRNNQEIPSKAWTREKAVHLLQLLITTRHSRLHKEQIIDLLWPELPPTKGDRDFRVALNTVQKALEPGRERRAPSRYIQRSELNYSINLDEFNIDVDAFERHLVKAHSGSLQASSNAYLDLKSAVELYRGDYLPERRYEDWTSSERERLRTLALTAMTRLAELTLSEDPLEVIRLTRRVLDIDPLWESAYRIEMQAHLALGNRPMAIRVFETCRRRLKKEYGLDPLPETEHIFKQIR